MIFEVLSRSRTALGGFRRTGWTMTPGPGYTVLQHILYCVVLGIVQKELAYQALQPGAISHFNQRLEDDGGIRPLHGPAQVLMSG